MKVVTIGLMGCSGCHVALVSLGEKVIRFFRDNELAHSYILVDSKEIPEEVDVGVVEGGIRTIHDEELVKELREKTSMLIAFGSCSCFGGVPGLCNMDELRELISVVYGEKGKLIVESRDLPRILPVVKPVDSVVKVDLYLPGCPPEPESIEELISSIVEGETLKLPSKNVCDECPREVRGVAPSKIKRVFEALDEEKCLLEQGYVCLGPVTRAGCGAKCPKANMPCEGCYGPGEKTEDQGLTMLDALITLLGESMIKARAKSINSLTNRYSFAKSILFKLMEGRVK